MYVVLQALDVVLQALAVRIASMRAGDTILALHTTSSQSMTPLPMELRAQRLVQLM